MRKQISSRVSIALLCLAIALLGSCSVKTKIPAGFAEVSGGSGSFRAISPEGLRYEVYDRANDPKQSLAFWNEAYEYRMKSSGYTSLGEASLLKTGMGEVSLHEWLLSWGNQEYVFAHAIGLKNDRVVVVQMGGLRSDYDEYRPALVDAIKTLN